MKCKYVRLKNPLDFIVIFPSNGLHNEISDKFGGKGNVHSAGFCYLSGGLIMTEGKSDSLGIGIDKEDAEIIQIHLQERR